MENQIELFKSNEFGEVRFLSIGDKEYAVGIDIAKALGYSDPSSTISKRCKHGIKQLINNKPCQNDNPHNKARNTQEMTLIPEGDIFRLIVNSKLPSAEKFESWVFDEVLPSIRKHGAYITEELLQDHDRLNNVIAELQMENSLKESRIEELEEVRTEYMKQRDKIIRIQIKCGNTKGNGRFIPYCILQLVREFIKDSENVEYRDDEIIKVNSRKLIRFVKGLFPKKYDAQSYLSQCLDINAWENVTVIPTNILEDEYEPLQDILY